MLMKAPVLHAPRQRIPVEDVEVDDPKAGEVRVRMAASGVCHSCLYSWDGSNPNPSVPMILGDEGAGVVEAIGPGVGRVRPGDHVVISWAPSCGQCHYCVIGRPVLCETRVFGGKMRDGTSRLHLNGTDLYQFGGVATYGSYTVIPDTCASRSLTKCPWTGRRSSAAQ